ncbi:MAG TPA: hypothetical protein VKE29_02825 [Candidatus Udaeobacter sp.]|nr:hypothetical protein [Candidatus Udaeobacter sp.]
MRGHYDRAVLLRLAEIVLILLVASVPVAMPAVLSVTIALGALSTGGTLLIIPAQRQAVLQLARDHEKLAAPAPHIAGGLSMLFSRPYRARTELVTIPWFLMDIATYGVGLFTPTILGAIEISGSTHGLAPRDFALAKGSALIDFFANWFHAWSLDGSAVRPHPNAGHWFCRNGRGHVAVTGSRQPNELEFAHSFMCSRDSFCSTC